MNPLTAYANNTVKIKITKIWGEAIKVSVNHHDSSGNELIPKQIYYYPKGVNVTVKSEMISGYHLSAGQNSSNHFQNLDEDKSYTFVYDRDLPPIVITGDASNINTDSAEITSNGYSGFNSYIIEQGIEYSSSIPMSNSRHEAGQAGNPAFNVSLKTLAPDETYYYRAYVRTGDGVFYGVIKSFRTQKPVSLINIRVNLVWNDSNNSKSLRPEIYRVSLLRDGVPLDTQTLDLMNQSGFTFSNLEEYRPNGTKYIYTVESPDSLQNYTTTVNNSTFTINNALKKYNITVDHVDKNTNTTISSEYLLVSAGDSITLYAKSLVGYTFSGEPLITFTNIQSDKIATFQYNRIVN